MKMVKIVSTVVKIMVICLKIMKILFLISPFVSLVSMHIIIDHNTWHISQSIRHE